MTTRDRYPTDPDHPEESSEVEALLARLVPAVAPAPDRAEALRRRLVERVREAADAEAVLVLHPLAGGRWQPLVKGVRVKPLSTDERAVLIEFAPGSGVPFHRHHDDEECIVLRGEVRLGELRAAAGDYHLAPSGSRHGRVRSEAGALIYLRGTPLGHARETLRDVATGLLPGRGPAPFTLRAGEGDWHRVAPGVHARVLFERPPGLHRREHSGVGRNHAHLTHESAAVQSCMLRFDPGTSLRLGDQPVARESLVVAGEVYCGRQPATCGDYQIAPAGQSCPELTSDDGAIVFVRGAPIV